MYSKNNIIFLINYIHILFSFFEYILFINQYSGSQNGFINITNKSTMDIYLHEFSNICINYDIKKKTQLVAKTHRGKIPHLDDAEFIELFSNVRA